MTLSRGLNLVAIVVALGLAFVWVSPVEAVDEEINIKARAISSRNIVQAASDLIDIRVSRWSTDDERNALINILEKEGNHALASALDEEEATGWVSFDPRGGSGPGRDPRRAPLKYAREIVSDDGKELILITNHYPGYSNDSRAADGAKLTNYPVSFVLLKLHQDADGEWTGIGRMFVGAKLRYETTSGKFVIDEFPMDPVYLKDVKIK